MNNLVLITSIIKTPDLPLSYISSRSVFDHQQRFEQTKKTIQSVKEKIPNSKILLVECSDFSHEEMNYFSNNCDYILNLYNKPEIRDNIYSPSKSLGEGTMTYCAINYILDNNINSGFNNFIKISGRYWLSNNFDYNIFNNNDIVVKRIPNCNVFTALYKLPISTLDNFKNYLLSNNDNMHKEVAYEWLFACFIRTIDGYKIVNIDPIGLNGYVSVCGTLYNG
jgi:hypothetical protein